jgi:osmotically inducible lipoprotein OsmB
MKRVSLAIIVPMTLFGLAACGYTTGDRAVSGGAIGAAGGAAAGALVGAPLGGALLGGAAGAATGALTSPSQIELGKPAWER